MPPTPEPTTTFERFNALRRRLGPAGPIAFIAAVVPPLGLTLLTTLALSTPLSAWMRDHPTTAVPAYVLIFWTLGIVAFPTYAYSILGGYAFGLPVGLPAAFIAYVGASCGGFAIGRYIARDRVLPLVAEHPKLLAIQHAIVGRSRARTTFLITLIRLSPATPFAIGNLAMGAIGLEWFPYIVATFVGVLPRTAALVWIASRMSKLTFNAGESYWLIGAGIVATVIAIGVVGVFVRRELDRQMAPRDPPLPPMSS